MYVSFFTFALIIAYWPNVEGSATTLRWCLLYACVPFIRSVDYRQLFIYAALGIGINSIFCLFQWYGYRPVVQIFKSPPGLFINGNILAETTALVIVGCIIYRLYYLLPLMVPAIILPMHRGSMIALVIVLPLVLKIKRPYLIIILAGLTSIALGLTVSRISSLEARLDLWAYAFDHLTLFGNGISSFRINYLNYADLLDNNYYVFHVHNDILELFYEYGIFAIIPITGIGAALLVRSPLRYVVIAFIIEGLFEFPLYMPTTLFIASVCFIGCLLDWRNNSIVIWHSRISAYARNGGVQSIQAAISS